MVTGLLPCVVLTCGLLCQRDPPGDSPQSLFEGLAGAVFLYLDLTIPLHSHFPGAASSTSLLVAQAPHNPC